MTLNRAQRRAAQRNPKAGPVSDHHHLERLAAQPQQVQVNPVITELAGCVPVVEDVTLSNGMQCKQLTLFHQSGVVGWRIPLPLPMAKDIGTKLCAPRGIEIPANPEAQAS